MQLDYAYFLYFPVVNLPAFVVGMALGKYFLSEEPGPKTAAAVFSRHGPMLSAAVAGAVVVGAYAGRRMPAPLLCILLVPAFGALIFALASTRGGLATWLSWRPIVVLGEASYALYLLHAPIMFRLGSLFGMTLHNDPARGTVQVPLSFFVLGVVLALGATVLLFKFVETPCRRWIRQALGA